MRTPREEVTQWDASHDVVIVGLGCAGASAAIEAGAAGADVLVLEGSAIGGGTSATSHSLLYLGGGTSLQKACGGAIGPSKTLAPQWCKRRSGRS